VVPGSTDHDLRKISLFSVSRELDRVQKGVRADERTPGGQNKGRGRSADAKFPSGEKKD